MVRAKACAAPVLLFCLICKTMGLDDQWARKARNRTILWDRHKHALWFFVWVAYSHDNSYLGLFNYYCPVNSVVCLPYCLISGTWWSKRATWPKWHVPDGINSTQIRGDCGLWPVWPCMLAFQHRGSLHMFGAIRVKTRKSVDWGQIYRKY